jgi:UPF0176 protein
MPTYTCSTFYALRPLEQPERQEILHRLREWPATTPPLKGLLIVAPDGINATIAGPAETVHQIEHWLGERLPLSEIKRSETDRPPFGLWKVVERRETVTSGPIGAAPPSTGDTHLSPEQFHQTLANEEVTLLDVRNDYEVRLGTFRGALDPKTRKFSEFAEFIDTAELPKDAKILTFCTGGIRCEKAVPFLKARGFQNVFQLSGGILNYLEQYPDGFFDGECFVFDERVAVDTHMKPSTQYRRCPRCGQPCGSTCPDCGYSD